MNSESATPDENNRPLPGALPCPFCGGTKIATYEGSTFRWRYASCNECGAQASEVRIETISLPRPEAIAQADKELLKEWNTRTLRSETDAQKDVITLCLRLCLEPVDSHSPETSEVLERYRPQWEAAAGGKVEPAARCVAVPRNVLEEINRDAWSDEKMRMRLIARTTDKLLKEAS